MALRRKGDSYHHGDLRRALIDAALELVSGKGVDALTLREAARRVGVTHSAPYRHFKDKAELVAAVRQEGFGLLYEHIEGARSAATDPVAAVKATGVAYVEFAVANPAHFRVMFGPKLEEQTQRDPALGHAAKRAFSVLTEALEACRLEGLVRQGDVLRHAVSAWSIVHGLAGLFVNGLLPTDELSVRERAMLVTDHLYGGLASDRDHPDSPDPDHSDDFNDPA